MCAMLYPDIRDWLLSMEGEDVFGDGRGCAKLREIVHLKTTVRSTNTGVKEKRGPGDAWGERQQGSGEARCGRVRREQPAVPMCQEGGAVTQQISSSISSSWLPYRGNSLSWWMSYYQLVDEISLIPPENLFHLHHEGHAVSSPCCKLKARAANPADTAWSSWQFLWCRWTSEVKCVTSGRCFNLNYTCPSEEQVSLSSLCYLLSWAAASMSKKGLSQGWRS